MPNFKSRISKLLVGLFFLTALGAMPISTPVAHAVTSSADCSVTTGTSTSFTITLQSNPIFYFDSAKSIYAGYAQFIITNKTGASVTGFKARLERTSGTALDVNANETPTHPFLLNPTSTTSSDVLADNASINSYWYLTANSATTTDQKFNVVIVDASGTDVCKLNRTFTDTAETIAASANKVTSVSYSDLPVSANDSGTATFTATVKGQTGTIGAGPSGNSDVNMSPSTKSGFAAGNYRLAATEYKCGGTSVTGKLYIANACAGNYEAIFTYQYISSTFAGGVDKAISPIMQIASGTQMKHTSATTFTIAAIGAPSTTTNSASGITSSAATLNGVINTGTFTLVYFCRSTVTPIAHTCTDTVTVTSSSSNYTLNWTGLSSSTTYYFEIAGESGGTTYYGGEKSFKTLASGAIDTTTAASSVTTSSATLNGTSSNLTPATSSDYYFLISDVDPGTGNHLDPSVDDTVTATSPSSGSYNGSATGLSANATYYYELIVIDSGAYYYGGVLNFTTPNNGGGGAPAPYVPHPPTITSISAPEVCALNGQLTISGTYLSGATVKVDGVAARVLSSSFSELTVNLPDASVGTKEIVVTNVDGSATTSVKYAFADTPVYVNFIYPETYKDRAFSYTFTATDAAKYAISGVLPAGLTLNPLTGEISGTPTQMGDYVFTIIASNICDTAPLLVYMFVDKPFPNAYTCSVAFNVPASNNISDIKLAQLKTCLSRIPDLSPKYIDPVIFLSGGIPAGLTSDEALTHPRYLPIIDLINSMNLDAQIYYGAFNGSTDSVQLNVYWPEPTV